MEALLLIKNKHFRAALECTGNKQFKLLNKALAELSAGGIAIKMPNKIKLYVNVFTQPYSSVDFYVSTPYESKEWAIKVLKSRKTPRSRYIDTVPVLISFKKYLNQQNKTLKK